MEHLKDIISETQKNKLNEDMVKNNSSNRITEEISLNIPNNKEIKYKHFPKEKIMNHPHDNHHNENEVTNNHHYFENREIQTFKKYKNIIYFVSTISVLIISYFLYKSFKQENQINQTYENEEQNDLIIKNELKEQNTAKINFMRYLDFSRIDEFYSDEEIRTSINDWKRYTYPYLGLERFAIPMISTISAGKSSTLNFILNLNNNKLQIGEKITTKFCMIIRHRNNLKKGKIYNVTIEKRADINKYNFQKANEIKEDIKTFIIERNKLIDKMQNDDKEIKDPNLYFIIMEIDTGLFDKEYEKYSNLVEFIDIPGLNEIGIKNNFYFKNVLPFIKMNFIFPLIILDSTKFESADVFNVFKEIFTPYISQYVEKNFFDRKIKYDIDNQRFILEKIKGNALFFINKLNLFKKTERGKVVEKIIKETSIEFYFNLNLGQNCLIINAKAKNLEVNKYSSFINYTEYIINKNDLDENMEISDILTDSFKEDFNFIVPENIEKNSKKKKNLEDYKEFTKLIINYNILRGNFKESQYFYFDEKFKEFLEKSNKKKMDNDGIMIKDTIKNKIRDLIDEYLNDNKFKTILENLKISEKELNEDFIKNINLENPLDIIHILDYPIKELKKVGFGNKGVSRLFEDYKQLTKFLENNIFIHYIILGIFSSGKSFTLNNIIGHNLYMLETGRAETNSHAFVIRNNKEINLFKAILEKNKYGYFLNKKEKIASGKDDVVKKIEYVNHNIKEFSYFILETPIQMFENISIPTEIINSIEIIDYPGLDTQKAVIGNYGNNSLFNKDIINGFIFINEPINNKINSVKEVFKNIINKFIYRDSKVDDIKNCLFLFTKNNDNEQTDFYNLDIKKEISGLMRDLRKEMDMTDILRIESKMEESLINFGKFSNIDYKKYIDLAERLKTFESFISYIINSKIKKIKKNNFESFFNNFNNFIEEKFGLKAENKNIGIFGYVTSFFNREDKKEKNKTLYQVDNIESYIDIFRNELIKIDFINKGYIFKKKEKTIIKDYGDKYLNLKNSLTYNKFYRKSFYEDFKKKVIHIMNYSKEIINKHINGYLNDIITETKGVIQTINKKFNMNQTEFERKFSEDTKQNIINNINKTYDLMAKEGNKEIEKLKNN